MTDEQQSQTKEEGKRLKAECNASGLTVFWAELKRRKVMRVGITYGVVAWLIIQVAATTFGSFGIPEWAFRFVVIMLCVFFPVAIILAWAFELTPDGIKTTKTAQAERGETPVSEKQQRKRNWVSLLFAAAVPTLIFSILALTFYIRSGGDAQISHGEKSIAVLAFANMSGDTENEYFSDGVCEELLNVLAKVPNLRVPARTSSFYFKGKNMPVQEIGQALNVQYVLQGSVRKAGDRVRITAQLIKVEDGYHMWSDTFTRSLKDIFALQDEIAGLIAKQLQIELGVVAKAKEVDPEAHRLLLEARFYWNQRGLDNFDRAAALLNRAMEIDPDFAQAYATLANVWVMQANYRLLDGAEDVSEELAQLRTSVNKALELNSSLVEPYHAMAFGLMLEGAMDESEEWFQKGFAISPYNPAAPHWYGVYLLQKGELLAGWKEYQRASGYDPLSFIIASDSGYCAYQLGRLEDALSILNRAGTLRPGGYIPAKSTTGVILWMLGRKTEAIQIARSTWQSWPVTPRMTADADSIWVLVQAGLDEEVAEYTKMLFSELPEKAYVRGSVLTALGRFEEAIPYLERTPNNYLSEFAGGAMFEPFRKGHRFMALIETLGLTKAYKQARADIEKEKNGRKELEGRS